MDSVPDGDTEALDVLLEPGNDLVAGHEAFRGVAFVLRAGQAEGPVRGDQSEGVPAIVSPRVGRRGRLFDNDVLAVSPAQVMARGQPRLPAADDDRFDRFAHVRFTTLARPDTTHSGLRTPADALVLVRASGGGASRGTTLRVG